MAQWTDHPSFFRRFVVRNPNQHQLQAGIVHAILSLPLVIKIFVVMVFSLKPLKDINSQFTTL